MTAFAEATAVHAVDSHTYTINLVDDWVIGSVPHGGYVTSCILRVVSTHFATTLKGQNQPHPFTLHLEFPRRTQVGLATFTVRDVKLGRQVSTVHVTLTQDGREEVVGYVNQANLDAEQGFSFETKWALQPRPLDAPDFAKLLRDEDEHWGERFEWPRLNFRKASGHLRSWFPRRGQPGAACLDMWFRFKDGPSRFTNESLGFVCDTFPQLLERYLLDDVDPYSIDFEREHSRNEQRRILDTMPSLWYPTVLLNIDFKKALPKEGVEFLFLRLQSKQIRNGRYDLELIVYDVEGDIVALSHHVVFAVGSERNIAARRTVGDGANGKGKDAKL